MITHATLQRVKLPARVCTSNAGLLPAQVMGAGQIDKVDCWREEGRVRVDKLIVRLDYDRSALL